MSGQVNDFVFLLKTYENLLVESSYKVLCLCKIWFTSHFIFPRRFTLKIKKNKTKQISKGYWENCLLLAYL